MDIQYSRAPLLKNLKSIFIQFKFSPIRHTRLFSSLRTYIHASKRPSLLKIDVYVIRFHIFSDIYNTRACTDPHSLSSKSPFYIISVHSTHTSTSLLLDSSYIPYIHLKWAGTSTFYSNILLFAPT